MYKHNSYFRQTNGHLIWRVFRKSAVTQGEVDAVWLSETGTVPDDEAWVKQGSFCRLNQGSSCFYIVPSFNFICNTELLARREVQCGVLFWQHLGKQHDFRAKVKVKTCQESKLLVLTQFDEVQSCSILQISCCGEGLNMSELKQFFW